MIDDTKLQELLFVPDLLPNIKGIGGQIKVKPEDFEVEEIPLYEASGEGEHVFLWIQKTGVAAFEMLDRLALRLGIDRREIGVAGQKDKHAITRQWVSVPFVLENDEQELIGELGDGIQVLKARRNERKLKRGHLKGNLFRIRIRDVRHAPDDVAQVAALLRQRGVPNFFGRQRFGNHRSTFWMGYRAILEDSAPKKLRRNKRLLGLSLNAVQSAVFNAVLATRVRDNTLWVPIDGDILETNEGLLRVTPERMEAAVALVDSGEATPLGPLPGGRLLKAEGEADALETRIMREFELSDEALSNSRFKRSIRGIRRPMTVDAGEISTHWEVEGEQHHLVTGFSLPSGSYATVLLANFMKLNPE